jgi:hypothetical protein
MQTQRNNPTLLRKARHLVQRVNNDFSTAVRCSPIRTGCAGRITPTQLTACICSGLLLFGYLPDAARAQSVANCQTTSTPLVFPLIADGTTELNGWAGDTDLPTALASFAVGDIDGDGNDELVSLPSYTAINAYQAGVVAVQVGRWIQTGWTPMAPITNAMLLSNLDVPANMLNNPAYVPFLTQFEVHLADVDGDGQKEVVVRMNGSLINQASSPRATTNFDQEQVYHYNTATRTWTLLTSYDTAGSSSMWMKANTTDKQQVRITLDNSQPNSRLNAATWANGKWNTASYSPIVTQHGKFATGCAHGMALQGYCIAFGDVTGDGLADLVYLASDGNYSHYLIPSVQGKPFGASEVFGGLQIHLALNDQLLNWQVGDIDGDGVSEVLIPDSTQQIGAYYWNNQANMFTSVADPNVELAQTASALGPFSSVQILPKPILTTNYDQQGMNPTVGPSMGLAAIGKSGLYVLKFTSSGGQHTFPGVYDFSNVPKLSSAISGDAGFAPSAYSGYFRLAVEGQNVVMLARSATGIVSMVQSGTAYVDPNTLSDRGYPAYTKSQQSAYQYISLNAAGNSDIRALYADPAVPWSYVQYQVESLAPPPTTAGISASDFQLVQKQTVDELTALQSVNLFYGVTGQILTNTYLVKDAALSEVTDALSLSSDPDVTAQTLSVLTSVLGGLGGIVGTAGSILQLAKDAATISNIINHINAASYVVSLMSTITGDIATYSPGSAPGSLSTGTFSLKSALDNSALGAATANACHQLEALSAWNQSRPIADGILTQAIPLDLETQQDLLQAGQSIFRMDVWQTLAPAKWDYYAVYGNGDFILTCGNCFFPGNASYPFADTVEVKASNTNCGNSSGQSFNPSGYYSFVLGDPQTHNWPNLNALNALFNAAPNGLGVNPSDVFFGKNGWSMQYGGFDNEFALNTHLGVAPSTCTSFTPLVPQVTPNIREGAITASVMGAGLVDPGRESTGARLENLIAEVKSNLTDAKLRDRLVMFLDVANSRLKQARQHHNRPTETLRLLNLFISQSQWHADHDFRDVEISRIQSIEAVGIRDSLLELMSSTRRSWLGNR